MKAIFHGTRPGRRTTWGAADFELPILYHRDDCFGLYFAVDADRVARYLPSERLHPVRLPGGKAVVAAVAYNYLETSIGTYGEVAVAVPAVFGRRPPTLLPALVETRWPGFGAVVCHLPVTRREARDAGRGQWGYTKFIADMEFFLSPESMHCRMAEGDRRILDLRVARRGVCQRDDKPLVTFSVKDGNLIRTIIPQRGLRRLSVNPTGSWLHLGDHPVAEELRQLGLPRKPLMAFSYPERAAVLPAGEVIETGVRPLDGYVGTDRAGRLSVRYR